jgi:DtxR family Mn-dependent transcriptional regulator
MDVYMTHKSDVTGKLSESAQMYLVNILRLSEQEDPVGLADLAESLGVSPVSANQMCRKLQSEGLLTYTPYKGVSVTSMGKRAAARVLRLHRLWEVFLVQSLSLPWEEAHEAACQLEHATTQHVAQRLDEYLNHPQVNPQGDPIPSEEGILPPSQSCTLANMKAGQMAHLLRCSADPTTCTFMDSLGLQPGAPLRLVAEAPDTLLVEAGGQRAVIDRTAASSLYVEINNEA